MGERRAREEGGHIGPPLQGGLPIEGWAMGDGLWIAWRFPGGTDRRGRRPLRDVLPIKGQSRKKADIYPLPPDERQRKEELVHSVKDKPPLNLIARGKSFRLRRSFSRAPASFPRTSFSLLDRARPVFSFSSGRKRENGGCIAPAIAGIQSPRPKGENKPPLCKSAIIAILSIEGDHT